MKPKLFIPEQTMQAIERAFPDRAPRDTDLSLTEAHRLIGQQQVMDFLRHHFQQQNIMEG